jgi:hypothetical protein
MVAGKIMPNTIYSKTSIPLSTGWSLSDRRRCGHSHSTGWNTGRRVER